MAVNVFAPWQIATAPPRVVHEGKTGENMECRWNVARLSFPGNKDSRGKT